MWVTLGCLVPLLATALAWLMLESVAWAILAGVCSIAAASGLGSLIDRFRLAAGGGPEQRAMSRLRSYSERHPEWCAHAYRTPLGLRVIATHRRFDPTEPAARDFFRHLDVDPLYPSERLRPAKCRSGSESSDAAAMRRNAVG